MLNLYLLLFQLYKIDEHVTCFYLWSI